VGLAVRLAGDGRERLEALLQEATSEQLSFADFLDRLIGEEVAQNPEEHQYAHEPSSFPLREKRG